MSKYEVVIKKIDRKRHHGFRYMVTVYWNRSEDRGDINWSYTHWGARREAKKMIKKHELPEEKQVVIEEYTL